jgi:uncharacterized repeat protein (TIGR03847 family)
MADRRPPNWVQTLLRDDSSPPLRGPFSPTARFFLPAGRCENSALASDSFDLKGVTRVTAGAVGEPGKRSFYLQMRAGAALISLAVEKEQLRALTERLQEVFSRVSVPAAGALPDMTLEEPIRPVWRVGFMTLTYSQDDKRFEVSLVELVEEGAEPATGRFEASLAQMQALATHTATVISAGRPPCPLCGGPIDHDGGICPRLNGHH